MTYLYQQVKSPDNGIPNCCDKAFTVARLKKGWSAKSRQRSAEDIGGAISFNIWQSSGQSVLDLENQGFQIETYSQRLDVLAEFSAYLLQIADRMLYQQFEHEQRESLVTAAGLHLASIMQDNRLETDGSGEYVNSYLKLLNQRISIYGACHFDLSEGPSFIFLRQLGDFVTEQVGHKDSQWITAYVIDHMGPSLFKQLYRVLPGLIDPALRQNENEDLMKQCNYDQ